MYSKNDRPIIEFITSNFIMSDPAIENLMKQVREQMAEVKQLKAELSSLNEELQAPSPLELRQLRMEVERLRKIRDEKLERRQASQEGFQNPNRTKIIAPNTSQIFTEHVDTYIRPHRALKEEDLPEGYKFGPEPTVLASVIVRDVPQEKTSAPMSIIVNAPPVNEEESQNKKEMENDAETTEDTDNKEKTENQNNTENKEDSENKKDLENNDDTDNKEETES